MARPYVYDRARIVRWIDGDTVELQIDLGFGVTKFLTARLADVDAKEMRSEGGPEALAAMRETFPEGDSATVRTFRRDWKDDRTGKYGRYLVWVFHDGMDAGQVLTEGGHIK